MPRPRILNTWVNYLFAVKHPQVAVGGLCANCASGDLSGGALAAESLPQHQEPLEHHASKADPWIHEPWFWMFEQPTVYALIFTK